MYTLVFSCKTSPTVNLTVRNKSINYIALQPYHEIIAIVRKHTIWNVMRLCWHKEGTERGRRTNRIPTNKADWKLDWVWRNICPGLRCGFNWMLKKITNLQLMFLLFLSTVIPLEYYFGIKVLYLMCVTWS